MQTCRKKSLMAYGCAIALVALLSFVATALVPLQAHAYYNQASTSYPATQDLGNYGPPIYGNDLPDGTYQVTARTSSRMCIMYTDPTNAEARDSKEQAIIDVSGGNITVYFYISKAYTHLYWGYAEDAAAATNEDGTDASAYIAGDPDEGYVPHLFALPISALNEPYTFAAYSGGDKGVSGGMWYTREVVFGMTEAEYQSYVGSVDEPVDDGSGQDDGQIDDEVIVDGGTENESSGEPEEEEPELENDAQPVLDEESVSQNDDSTSDESGGAGGDGAEDSGTGIENGESDDGDGAASGQGAAGAAGKRGVRMSIAGSKISIDVDENLQPPEEPTKPLLTPRQICGLVALAIFVAGLLLRVVIFNRGYERAASPALAHIATPVDG